MNKVKSVALGLLYFGVIFGMDIPNRPSRQKIRQASPNNRRLLPPLVGNGFVVLPQDVADTLVGEVKQRNIKYCIERYVVPHNPELDISDKIQKILNICTNPEHMEVTAGTIEVWLIKESKDKKSDRYNPGALINKLRELEDEIQSIANKPKLPRRSTSLTRA